MCFVLAVRQSVHPAVFFAGKLTQLADRRLLSCQSVDVSLSVATHARRQLSFALYSRLLGLLSVCRDVDVCLSESALSSSHPVLCVARHQRRHHLCRHPTAAAAAAAVVSVP